MHEKERHRIILATVQARPVASVGELVDIIGVSEATIRRDIAALDESGALKRVRGGAEALDPPSQNALIGRPFSVSETLNLAAKRAIARTAAALCNDGDQIIINGGTTTFQMVPHLAPKHLTVFTNSFPIAEYLVHNSRNSVVIPGGTIYREQQIVISPFGGAVASHFYAKRMFLGCHGLSAHGVMEADPLVVQSELALMGQADEVIVLADSSKFRARTSLILCALDKISTIITDSGLGTDDRTMLSDAGVDLVIADTSADRAQPSESA